MESDFFVASASHTMWILMLACAPLLIPTLIVGVLVGMVQAATSINEATLTFVPKLIVFALVIILFGSAILVLLTDFTQDIFARIPEIVR
jgi:flagellar biosynthesis protein FliQ